MVAQSEDQAPSRIEDRLLIVTRPLLPDVIEGLDQIAAMVPARPYEAMILPFGRNYVEPDIANMGAAVQVGKLNL